eukprot:3819121-Rhodomonas_salina.2
MMMTGERVAEIGERAMMMTASEGEVTRRGPCFGSPGVRTVLKCELEAAAWARLGGTGSHGH